VRNVGKQFGKWFKVMPVLCGHTQLFKTLIAIDSRTSESEHHPDGSWLETQQIILDVSTKVTVIGFRICCGQAFGKRATLLGVSQRGEILLIDQGCEIGPQSECQ
jgi:hypothetical protein